VLRAMESVARVNQIHTNCLNLHFEIPFQLLSLVIFPVSIACPAGGGTVTVKNNLTTIIGNSPQICNFVIPKVKISLHSCRS